MEVNGIQAMITIPVPADFVLVPRDEWARLSRLNDTNAEDGDQKWLKNKVGIQNAKKLDEVLLTPFFKELDSRNGGPIQFGGQGSAWKVNKRRFLAWYDTNWNRIWGGVKS